jgi:hypothetical protein
MARRVKVLLGGRALRSSSSSGIGHGGGFAHYPSDPKAPSGSAVGRQGRRRVRRPFFGTIGNIGDGPLELRAENNATMGTTNAIQEIYTHLGPLGGKNPAITLVSSTLIGTFVFHPAHNHWHMADFARYELRAINPDGSTGPVVRPPTRSASA